MSSAAISEILDVDSQIQFFSDITKYEYHSHTSYSGQKLGNSDEIRIPVNQMDVYTLPCKSYLFIEGSAKCTKPGAKETDPPVAAEYKLISNAVGHLFDEIRYELAGQSVAKSRLVGITSTIKGLLLKSVFDTNTYHLAGFDREGYKLNTNGKFVFCVPMKLLLPFFEDFQRIILNLKQELVLLRSASDINCFESATGKNVSLTIEKIQWKMPYIFLEDHVRLRFLKMLDSDRALKLSFRSWQIYELPNMTSSRIHSWAIKTASHLDVPRYVILAFQTSRKNTISKTMSDFDLCDLYNVKLFLNSQYYPYDSLLGNKEIMYRMFLDFAPSYYNRPVNAEHGNDVNFKIFCEKSPIIVIDCSHQSDHLKTSTDIRLDMEFNKEIPPDTSAYCILVSDTIMEYTPLTSLVREVQ